jgi:hypothetical protein
MKKLVILAAVPLLIAQTPDFSGVWQANPEKSKGLPPNSKMIVIIEKDGNRLKRSTGLFGEHGEQRSTILYDVSGKDWIGSWRGVPAKTHTAFSGSTMTVETVTAGPRPMNMKSVFALSPDGKTMTLTGTNDMGRGEWEIVFEKQPESAGEPLRKPEVTAAERFKNVQIMKDVPASQFMDAMRSFTIALGADCDFCHTQGDFSKDDKQEKQMARTMIKLARAVNKDYFNGHNEVRCYTCHQGHHEPQSRPAFASTN